MYEKILLFILFAFVFIIVLIIFDYIETNY